MNYRYNDVILDGEPCVFVSRGGLPVGYIKRIDWRGKTRRHGIRWRRYASWLGHRLEDNGARYTTRRQAAEGFNV